jgi:hypothetical protein
MALKTTDKIYLTTKKDFFDSLNGYLIINNDSAYHEKMQILILISTIVICFTTSF